MTQRRYTIDDVEMLIAKGRLARSRALAGAVAGMAQGVLALFKPAVEAASRRVEQARAVRELRDMDARMLADIGLTPGEIELAAAGALVRLAGERPRQPAANESVARPLQAAPKAA